MVNRLTEPKNRLIQPKNRLTDFFDLITVQELDEPLRLTKKCLTEICGSVTVRNCFEPKKRLTNFRLTETPVNGFCTPLVITSTGKIIIRSLII